MNTIDGRDLTNPLPLDEKFNALHASLIPDGPHRGNVLVVDGNLRLTHHDGGGQRCIILPSQPHPSNQDATITSTRQFTVLNNQFQVPRGWYMLFLVTNQGAPSDLAYWVHVN